MEENQNQNQNQNQEEIKTLDDLMKGNKDLQSEVDKKISKALETAKQKWQAESDNKLKEAEKLAKLSAQEKIEYENKQKEEILSKRERELEIRELKATAQGELVSKGLPSSFADLLNYTDAETCKTSITNLEKAFKEAVENEVNSKLKGNAGNRKEGISTGNKATDLFSILRENSRRSIQ